MTTEPVQPTQGPITFREDGDANHWSMLTEDGRWWLALLANGEQTSERQKANMRRLAACWNACEGLSTEALERMPGTFAQAMLHNNFLELWSEYADAKAQRDELLEALETLVEHFEYYMGDNECRPLENARAAIAKATGARHEAAPQRT